MLDRHTDRDSWFGRQRFTDRRAAGRELARALRAYVGTEPVVLGLPRGGVPVADEVARALGGTLDVWVARKLGVPGHEELGMGAIAEGPAVIVDRGLVHGLGIRSSELRAVARREMAEMAHRVARFRGGRPPPTLAGRVVIVVDDGIATGGTMRAVLRAVTRQRPSRLIIAVPVAAPDTIDRLAVEADDVVCLREPDQLYAIGLWYDDFTQVADDEVVAILERAQAPDSDGEK